MEVLAGSLARLSAEARIMRKSDILIWLAIFVFIASLQLITSGYNWGKVITQAVIIASVVTGGTVAIRNRRPGV